MLTHGTDSITGQLVVLFNSIWREQEVPDDWKKGIVKLPKRVISVTATTGGELLCYQLQARS